MPQKPGNNGGLTGYPETTRQCLTGLAETNYLQGIERCRFSETNSETAARYLIAS